MKYSLAFICRLPDGFTMLFNLTHVYLNDTFLDFLPANIGRYVLKYIFTSHYVSFYFVIFQNDLVLSDSKKLCTVFCF